MEPKLLGLNQTIMFYFIILLLYPYPKKIGFWWSPKTIRLFQTSKLVWTYRRKERWVSRILYRSEKPHFKILEKRVHITNFFISITDIILIEQLKVPAACSSSKTVHDSIWNTRVSRITNCLVFSLSIWVRSYNNTGPYIWGTAL